MQFGATPLQCASEQGHIQVAAYLLQQGALVDQLDEGVGPLSISFFCGYGLDCFIIMYPLDYFIFMYNELISLIL